MTLTRYLLRGYLELLTPLHVGSGRANDLTDSPLRTDVAGLPVIPGTALGGVMRSQAERFTPALAVTGGEKCKGPEAGECKCLVCKLFGAVDAVSEKDRTSRLVIRDAFLQNVSSPEDAPSVEIRDGIGISRMRGTVNQRLKFDLAVLPAGLRFDFEMQLDTDEPEQLQLLCAVLAELSSGRVTLGGRSGRGTGRVQLVMETTTANGFGQNDIANLKTYLKASPLARRSLSFSTSKLDILAEAAKLPVKSEATTIDRVNFIEAHIRLSFEYGVLLNNPAQAILDASDGAFVRTRHPVTGNASLFLPGSSLRGMLRSQAERIARTLSYVRANGNENTYIDNIAACDPVETALTDDTDERFALLACSAFMRDKIEDAKKHMSAKELAAWIEENSCLACRLFGNSYRMGRLKVSDALPVAGAISPNGKNRQRMDFVAIDRFTGGARDTAKFDAATQFAHKDNSLEFSFTLSLRDIDPQSDKWMLGWLAFLVRDLLVGELRLGLGKTKGLGKITGTLERLTIGGLGTTTPFAPDKAAMDRPEFFRLFQFTSADLNETNKQFLINYAEVFTDTVNNFERTRAGVANV